MFGPEKKQTPNCCPEASCITWALASRCSDIDEDGWVLGLYGTDEPNFFLIYFCPWCGQRLPKTPKER
jgi:hypothetical protein